MDPATIALVIKGLDLMLLTITAGMTYAESREKQSSLIDAIEALRSEAALGDLTAEQYGLRLNALIRQAQSARKTAKAAVPVPTHENYRR